MAGPKLAVGSDITPTISTWLSRSFSGIMANNYCGYKHVDIIIATLNSAIYVVLLLCVSC